MPFQIPYREARDGYWGDQTSTLNWCEEVCAPFLLGHPRVAHHKDG